MKPAARPCLVLGLALLACNEPATVSTDLAGVFDLADLIAETVEVRPGDYEQRRHLGVGWSPPEEDETGAFAWGVGEGSSVLWNLTWSRPLDLVLTGRPVAATATEPVQVRVSWNEKFLGNVTLTPQAGQEEYRLPVPADVQVPGPNEIRLDYPTASQGTTAPEAEAPSRPGAASPRTRGRSARKGAVVAWSRIRIEGAGAGARPSADPEGKLRVPFRTGLDHYVLLPEGGVLELEDVEPYGPQGVWRRAEPAPHLLATARRHATGSDTTRITLSGGAGRLALPAHDGPLRIRIEPVAGARLPEAEAGFRFSAVLHSPMSPWPHSAAAEASTTSVDGNESVDGAAGTSDPSATPPPHILIFLVDTLRADRLGCYGYDRPTSPNIDRFATDAVRFDHPVAQSSWTRPATASILTGLYPHNHGARTRNQKLAEDVPYLPEVLRELGYRALGVSTNGNAGPRFGFRRGFSHFKHMEERSSRPGIHVPVWRAVDETLEWLERIRPGDSFFVFLHVSDPHAPYLPPEHLRRRFAPDAAPGPGTLTTHDPAGASHSTSDLEDLYDGEIALVDEHFGRMVDELDQRGFLDDTIVVFVSDHGEEFQDHGLHGHGATLYQEQLRVPLIIRLPNRLRSAEGPAVVETQVQQIDIVPTILEAIGHAGAMKTDGRSLLPLMVSDQGGSRPTLAVSELRLDGRVADAVFLEGAHGRRKLIEYRGGPFQADSARQMFDPSRDLGELLDLEAEEPLWAGYLATLGRLQRRGARILTAGVEPVLPAEQREALRALGYLN